MPQQPRAGSYPIAMLSPRSSTNTSDGDSSSNTKAAIIAGAVVGSLCVLGLVFMWGYLWRRRNLQFRGDAEDLERELNAMHAPGSENIRSTTEFQWPARAGEASGRRGHLQHGQERPEKEVCLGSTTSFPKPSTPFSSELYKHHEQEQQQQQQQHDLKLKKSVLSMYPPELAELPPHEVPGLYHHMQQPQELPVPSPPPVVAHELEGNLSPETPGVRHRW